MCLVNAARTITETGTISTASVLIIALQRKKSIKNNSYKASFGSNIVEKLLFIAYTTKTRAKVIRRTKETITVNVEVVTRKPMKLKLVIEIN
jgi:hypothetical protein